MKKRQFVPTLSGYALEDRVMLNAAPVGATLIVAPVFRLAALPSTVAQVSWNTVPGSTSYWVDKWSGTQWTNIAIVGPTTTQIVVGGLTPGGTYYFDVAHISRTSSGWEPMQGIKMPYPIGPSTIHPISPGTYQVVNGSLFGPNGPEYYDVKQGNIGDCWLVASLAEAAGRDPALVRSMFTYLGTYNENGNIVQLYDVRLFTGNGGPAREIMVDNEFAMSGGTEYNAQVLGGVLWAALAEKAYVIAAAEGYVVNSITSTFHALPSNDYSYTDVIGGWPYWALNAITGHASTEYYSVNNATLNTEMTVDDGLVVLATGNPTNSLIVGGHCYALLADHPGATWQFTLFNPWNAGSIVNYDGHSVYGSLFYCNQAFLDQNFDGFGFAVA